MNLKSESQNSKWRIQHGDLAYNISVNCRFFCCNWLENSYSVISAVGDDDFEVILKKLKMADAKWRSHTQNSINFEFSCYDWSKLWDFEDHWRWFEIQILIWDNGSSMAATYTFSRENQRFYSGKRENYQLSVWEITTNLITNPNSAIENPILQSHTWYFDIIHLNPYSFVWNIRNGFPHLSCQIIFWRFELKFIGIYLFFLNTNIIFE